MIPVFPNQQPKRRSPEELRACEERWRDWESSGEMQTLENFDQIGAELFRERVFDDHPSCSVPLERSRGEKNDKQRSERSVPETGNATPPMDKLNSPSPPLDWLPKYNENSLNGLVQKALLTSPPRAHTSDPAHQIISASKKSLPPDPPGWSFSAAPANNDLAIPLGSVSEPSTATSTTSEAGSSSEFFRDLEDSAHAPEPLISPRPRKLRTLLSSSNQWLAKDNEKRLQSLAEYGTLAGDKDETVPAVDSTQSGSTQSETSSDTATVGAEEEPPYVPPEGDQTGIERYFSIWTGASIIAILLNLLNVNWKLLIANESWGMTILSTIFLLIQGFLQWSVLELPLMSLAAVFVKSVPDQVGDGRHLTVAINYNLLASEKGEVDAAMGNAYKAYVGNMGPSVVGVLVSATGDEELKLYELQTRDSMREQIFELVLQEGAEWFNGEVVDEGRANRMFEIYRDETTRQIPDDFLDKTLPELANKYAKDFMVVQRVTRVLRKCGQYQDLCLLSEGDNSAWTYTDGNLYNEAARKYGEHLFYPSDDVENVQGRKIDYTLVLDGDTGVVKDSLARLMDIAAANPDRAILQPAIEMIAGEDESLFMHIDKVRQDINAPISAALTSLLGRSGFFGKGLIQNRLYIRALLGTREKPIEKVPINVLSHDTFEAGALSPLYVTSVHLLEEPCGNYVTWDIRECRWNRGELVLSHYFFPRSFGAMFTWCMHKAREKPPTKLTLRTETNLDGAGAYIAHSALRQMFLKPALFFYIVSTVWVKTYLYHNWMPLGIMLFLILVLPKIPLVRRDNLHLVIAESICSILQYSPEPIIGTFRLYKSVSSHITGVSGWVPQFKVEQDFAIKPAMVASFSYQWKICLLTCGMLTPILILQPDDFLLHYLFMITAFLPVYTTLTALPCSSYQRRAKEISTFFRSIVEGLSWKVQSFGLLGFSGRPVYSKVSNPNDL